MMEEFKKRGHDVVYWLGYEGRDSEAPPGTTFHSYEDALLGRPASALASLELEPPGAELIKKFYRLESLVLTMMNRIADDKCVDERRHLYYKMLSYWLGVLKKYQPEAIIFPVPPHFAYDFVIYELAKFLNIKTLMFLDTRIPGRALFLNDIWRGSGDLQEKLRENAGKNFQLEELSSDIKKYYLMNTDKNYNALPPHIRYQKIKYSLWYRIFYSSKLMESIRDLSIFKRGWGFLRRAILKKDFLKPVLFLFGGLLKDNLKKEYARFQLPPDFSKNFVYAPLNVQPEQSTSPQGDMFADQILMIEILASVLPKGWLIYVKEHPIQWLRSGVEFSSSKYRGYYKKISEIKNVCLVPVETSSNRLIKESQAVAAISGAAGWEAVLRSKPAMIFGYPWYLDCPGLFRVSDSDSCKEALKKINQGFLLDRQQIINYLSSLDKAAIRAFLTPNAGEDANLTFEESMSNITNKLIEELKL